ncbi:MAG: hypothetical protein DBX44_08420 [Oscillospiraceae bacterium]|nr:MAG: hypothetical protein DBX44_08420 [Oscillospiraceae bacterium]
MKKLTRAVTVLLALLLLAACGSGSESKQLDLDAFARQVIDSVEYDDDMIQLNEQIASEYYNLSFDGLESWIAYGSGTAATTNVLMVMKLKDSAAVEEAKKTVQQRIEDQTANYEGYRPDELFRLENSIVLVEGDYLLFSISPDNDTVRKLFEDALK